MPVTDITTDPESLTMTLVVDASASVITSGAPSTPTSAWRTSSKRVCRS